jgi:S1-C subfamily serine protease
MAKRARLAIKAVRSLTLQRGAGRFLHRLRPERAGRPVELCKRLAKCLPMEFTRRIIMAAAILTIAAGLYLSSRPQTPDYGLTKLMKGEPPMDGEGVKLNLKDTRVLAEMNNTFARLSEEVLPAVVSVTTRKEVPAMVTLSPFGLLGRDPQSVSGQGSGAIISKDGLVVTNYHVVADVSEFSITTNDNQMYAAKVLGYDSERDIALLRIESNKKDFPFLSFANSDEAKVGHIVFAVGNPFGLSGTVTQGIISARDRHISDSRMDYLQTDAVINPGNSGGPLVDTSGRIVGVNVAIYQGDQRLKTWQGIGLSVPSNEVKVVVDAIKKAHDQREQARLSGESMLGKGYLGLAVFTEPVEVDPAWGSSEIGAIISHVDPKSPAAIAGLKPGDVVTKFQGMSFRMPADLLQIIRTQPPGSKVKLEVIRNNRMREVMAHLGERPEDQPTPTPAPNAAPN